jgi:hypothetical protein
MTDSALPPLSDEVLDMLLPATSQEYLDEAAIASDLEPEAQDSSDSEEGFQEV